MESKWDHLDKLILESVLNFKFLFRDISNKSLCFYRIGFGILLQVLVLRFFFKGYIEKYFIEPKFFFKYYAFYFPNINGEYFYIIFSLMYLFSFLITMGLFYKFAIISFTIFFTYFHFYDITYYLNHYYLVNLICFLLCFQNLGENYSVKNYFSNKKTTTTKAYHLYLILFQISIVYFFGFVAKLKSDWLFEALPVSIWLKQKLDLPILGYFFQFRFTSYFVSYFGFIFDLCIPFVLISKFKNYGVFFAFLFHISTSILFQIGMFPYIMLTSIFLFYSNFKTINENEVEHKKLFLIIVYILFQILFPLRFLFYKNLSWREEGFRFSWNIMVIEKRGSIEFRILDKKTKKEFLVNPENYLTNFQVFMMATQPDMILEFAKFLKKEFGDVKIYADSFVSLNGRESKRFINPKIDLSVIEESFKPKNFILEE